jgi:hypothetical protein
MTEQNNGELYARIAKVTALLAGKLRADKTHEQQRYSYLSADQILQEVGNAMADNGLAVVPGVTGSQSELLEPVNKKPFYNSTVTFIMYVSDIDGNVFETPWVGMGADYTAPDKATYKAITSGHKYFLMKLFNIGIGNMDSEHDAEPLETRQPLPQQQPKRQKQPKPQATPATQAARSAEAAKNLLLETADKNTSPANEKQLKFARASLSKLVNGSASDAKTILNHVFAVESSADLTSGEASAIIEWAGSKKENGYTPNPESIIEAARLVTAANVDAGQEPLFSDEPTSNNYDD